ncbi:leucine-rich_repeat domain-containing protein [Hexamita inflata]|uniref:Leucine-rich repeat domain-containing protein n=1 Tax=Hexamita inflata TaxID=28002 RepID=A0AA86UZK6_9EUKA|nr:leucine-rich repeat domain-containing protein [Hexamita inflata]
MSSHMEQNILNLKYDTKMTKKYNSKIKDGNLEIGDCRIGKGDPEVTNLRFIEQLKITTLKLFISIDMHVKLKINTIQELFLKQINRVDQLNLKVNDFELENLEVLYLQENNLENDQLYNLNKFKKLHTLSVSCNKVDLTHIHSVISLTKLYMQQCEIKNVDLIESLINLKLLDLSLNIGIDISPLCKVKSLSKLFIRECGLTQIDQIGSLNQIASLTNLEDLYLNANEGIDLNALCKVKSLLKLNISECKLKQIDWIGSLTNLEVLQVSSNELLKIDTIRILVNLKKLIVNFNYKIDIAPLEYLVGLIKLDAKKCGLRQLSALKSLINLEALNVSSNYFLNITAIQYLVNLTHLNLKDCNLVSIYALRPLVKLERLQISNNDLVYLDSNLNEMKQLIQLNVQFNRIIDFSSLEQHQNYNSINEDGQRCFNISNQTKPFQEELRYANQMKNIESPNIQLREIQNKRKTLKTIFNAFKLKINAVPIRLHSDQIQFTSSAVRLFKQLDLLDQLGQ